MVHTSPYILNIHPSSSSILVIPSNFLACCIFTPCAPIAKPIKSSLTENSSENLQGNFKIFNKYVSQQWSVHKYLVNKYISLYYIYKVLFKMVVQL